MTGWFGVSTGPSEEIVRRLDSDHSFYLIEDGSFEVEVEGSVVRVLGPGGHFGELAAWIGGPGTATCGSPRCAAWDLAIVPAHQ